MPGDPDRPLQSLGQPAEAKQTLAVGSKNVRATDALRVVNQCHFASTNVTSMSILRTLEDRDLHKVVLCYSDCGGQRHTHTHTIMLWFHQLYVSICIWKIQYRYNTERDVLKGVNEFKNCAQWINARFEISLVSTFSLSRGKARMGFRRIASLESANTTWMLSPHTPDQPEPRESWEIKVPFRYTPSVFMSSCPQPLRTPTTWIIRRQHLRLPCQTAGAVEGSRPLSPASS